MNQELGKFIREKRRKLRIPQEELARRFEVRVDFLRRLERGDIPAPSESFIRSVAKELQEDVEFICKLAGYIVWHHE